ncbi:MAG TPA: mobilization protein [Paludibacter sp.]
MDFEKLNDSLNGFLNNEKVSAPEYSEDQMWGIVESAQISYTDNIRKPPAIMSIWQDGKQIPIMTRGNFSLFKGQAKSRKTFGSSMIAASLAYDIKLYDTFIPNMKGKTTLFIDTEQSEYHVYRFVNSVVNLSGFDGQHPNFRALCLRPFETAMRLKIVEFLIYNAKNLGYVVIDGIRDLIKDFNSLDESTMICDKLLKWTKEKNIHISVVLHENPSRDGSMNKARGHLGTELANKAETVIGFEKSKEDKRETIIRSDDTRGEEFEPIYFKIDQNERGLFPVIVEKNVYISKKEPDRF